ncbi:hypothetical protein GDO81_018436 [Engystomops pustulosus]|uniref:Uncharacterized protein n=1 Tax=Engystomops pustulosus TaxID=76066 RepID=A0AAV6ZSJ8_ENGPU|nr:hypothetical protein GDO81_018436 [Engystomops pustulosus]
MWVGDQMDHYEQCFYKIHVLDTYVKAPMINGSSGDFCSIPPVIVGSSSSCDLVTEKLLRCITIYSLVPSPCNLYLPVEGSSGVGVLYLGWRLVLPCNGPLLHVNGHVQSPRLDRLDVTVSQRWWNAVTLCWRYRSFLLYKVAQCFKCILKFDLQDKSPFIGKLTTFSFMICRGRSA